MQLPRFSRLDTSLLKRWRVQCLFVAVVWMIVGVIRATGTDHSFIAITISVLVWVVAVGFVVTSVLSHLEIRRRALESA